MLLVARASAAVAATGLEADVAGELRRLVSATPDAAGALLSAGRIRDVYTFYESRRFTPVWIEDGHANDRALAVLDSLRGAPEVGLAVSDYAVARIAALIDQGAPEALPEIELLLSAAFVRYASDLRNGQLAPHTLHPGHYAYPREVDATALLAGLTEAEDPAGFVRSIAAPAPDNAIDAGLRRALRGYREIEAAGGWPAVPPGATLKPGDQGWTIGLLRRRLQITGDLGAANGPADVFDRDLEDAVKKFQRRHGLAADGVVGPKTLAALNVPVETRLRQLILNLERARWLPDDLGRRHILVNIAGFEAWVVEDGRPSLRMKAIVGKSYQQTPAFSDEMTYLVLNPYWNVPPGITRRETIPAVSKDPGYLADNDMEVVAGWEPDAAVVDPAAIDWQAMASGNFPYRFRQKPGAKNALGRVKFMFPNEHNVYMHDTPARRLFERTVRTFSHGCIRISEPLELAAHLLGDQPGWSRSRIDQLIESGAHEVVPLKRAVPVHVSYFTAWSDGGEVNFREDVYGRDSRLIEALTADAASAPSV